MVDPNIGTASTPDIDPEVLTRLGLRIRALFRAGGLPFHDAEDATQMLLLWAVARNQLSRLLDRATAKAFCRYWSLRYWRLRGIEERRCAGMASLRGLTARSQDPDLQISIRQAERSINGLERRLLADMRLDWSWSEAASRQQIKPGSRDRVKKRLAGKLRRALRPSVLV